MVGVIYIIISIVIKVEGEFSAHNPPLSHYPTRSTTISTTDEHNGQYSTALTSLPAGFIIHMLGGEGRKGLGFSHPLLQISGSMWMSNVSVKMILCCLFIRVWVLFKKFLK